MSTTEIREKRRDEAKALVLKKRSIIATTMQRAVENGLVEKSAGEIITTTMQQVVENGLVEKSAGKSGQTITRKATAPRSN